ncbi:uncharacterized protein LOC122613701 [Drosophila teissieri]|uniref:uncharacterized protein LOC122613701 n=1 Tax=Drosophila teissieri TaxID=7243 RepID=UPI001CBA5117|nr:uncharacterized protein LOC122613701 [Drosophila teissieri]XP_043643947.1 uncharacterized protein LOC122613701 [Drosophila teissieri]XP_043643948.1 uncharacterized protein LOC122613701 [Drosophila teissieri]XP_043643949.1 uncharacterized protein LOC122613701 [Drosophila teissieri]
MSRILVAAFAFVAICLILVSAAPAPAPPTQILDARTAIEKIIAAYNRIPGPSVVHPWEVATLVDPNTFVAHF